jgi:hypothetical protein
MSKNEKRKSSEILLGFWDKLWQRYRLLEGEQARLDRKRTETLQKMLQTRNALRLLKEIDPTINLEELLIPYELRYSLDRAITLGDAISMILEEKKALTRKELLEHLTKIHYPLRQKNARIVIAKAINNDTQKRFVSSEDGKVRLAKPNKKANPNELA